MREVGSNVVRTIYPSFIVTVLVGGTMLLAGCQPQPAIPSTSTAEAVEVAPTPTAPPETAPATQAALPLAPAAVDRYVLPAIQLQSIEPAIAGDRGITLGGIGSDLWHGPGDAPNQFWMITDRGPNGQVKVKGKNRRTFPVPEFAPAILHVETGDGAIKLLQVIPLAASDGAPVSGLPNLANHDDEGYTFDGGSTLPYDPSGLDTEGLVRTSQGDFWAVEEYAPSLLHIAGDGRVLERIVPQGLDYSAADYPVAAALPAVYARRNSNRGFEGIALSPDEQTVYAVLQSPLDNPDKDVRATARVTRILALDRASGALISEYAYVMEPFGAFDPGAADQTDMKISGLVALTADRLLVLERTDAVAKVYAVDLHAATNLLGTRWDDPATVPSLEAAPDLAAAGVTALPKSLVLDLGGLPAMPAKIEGIAVVDANTLAFANDNDFDLGGFDSAGNNQPGGVANEIVVVALDGALK